MQVVAGSNPSCHISLQYRFYFFLIFLFQKLFFKVFFQDFIRFVRHASFFEIFNINLIYMRKVWFRVRVSQIKDATDRLRFLNAQRRNAEVATSLVTSCNRLVYQQADIKMHSHGVQQLVEDRLVAS